MTPNLICATVEVALNRTLRLEPEVLGDFAQLDGRVLALTIDGLEWSFFIECIPGGVRVLPSFERADVHLHGGVLGYAQLAQQFCIELRLGRADADPLAVLRLVHRVERRATAGDAATPARPCQPARSPRGSVSWPAVGRPCG